MKVFKKILGVFCLIMAITSIALLIDTHNAVFVIEIGLWVFLAFMLFRKKKSYNKSSEPIEETNTTIETQTASKLSDSKKNLVDIKFIHSEVPQQTLDDMKKYYSREQATNEIRIINESLEIIKTTSSIDTFLSRYDLAMKNILTLEQAKKAGIPINLPDNFSKSLLDYKGKGLEDVLYRSFQKELEAVQALKTDKGKLNRINKYQQKLEELFETEFEFVAEDAYNSVMQKIELFKKQLNN